MNAVIKILFVEDNPEDAELTKWELTRAGIVFEALRVETPEACREALRTFRPDVVLADYTLPRMNALGVIDLVKAEAPEAPVLVVTGTIGEETAVACLKAGASDYLLKDRLSRLGPALIAALKSRRVEDQRLLLSTAVEQAAESILITDREGTIEYVNPAFEKTTGYGREEALGRNPRILKSGRHENAFYAEMWSVLGRGEVWRGRLVNRRRDGTLFEEDATISPVRDATGKTIRYVAVNRDVSREVALQRQLEESQRIEALGRLAGGIAHDFNNLLGVMRGFAEYLLRYPAAPEDLKSALEEIVRAADGGAKLTSQLLAFGRRQVLQPVVVDVQAILSDLATMLRSVLGEDVLLEVSVPETILVLVDPSRFEQVLLNLVLNARDAMPTGGRLQIRATMAGDQVSGKPAARLTITDSGVGMAPETLAHIFEPFFTTKKKGTGLGLSTVYGIVHQSGGTIRVESSPGAGTTFEILLPLAGRKESIETSMTSGPLKVLGRGTILLVEDLAPLRTVVSRSLQAYGFGVIEAGSGEEALAAVSTHEGAIDLLLTDIVMPGMSGRDLAARLSSERPGLRILYMTGYGADVSAPEGVVDAGVRIIEKPFRMEKLFKAVVETLAG
jgi:PAS domain S-box-containing protein